jgi:hypothetical protein
VVLHPAGRFSLVKYAQIGVIGYHGWPPYSTVPLSTPEEITDSILRLEEWHCHTRIVHLSLGTHVEEILDLKIQRELLAVHKRSSFTSKYSLAVTSSHLGMVY